MRFFIAIFLLLSSNLSAQIPPRPEPARYINDYADILTTYAEQTLEQNLYRNFRDNSNQIVFVLLDVLPPNMTIEAFSNDLYNKWGIGSKENNNGILVVVAMQLRKIRIEVGYGFEAVLPDALAAQLIDKYITPNFKINQYAAGISELSDKLIKITEGTFIKTPNSKEYRWDIYFFLALMLPLYLHLARRLFKNYDGDNRASVLFVFFVICFVIYFVIYLVLVKNPLFPNILESFYEYIYFLLILEIGIVLYFFLKYSKTTLRYRLLWPLILVVGALYCIEPLKTSKIYSLDFTFWMLHIAFWTSITFTILQVQGIRVRNLFYYNEAWDSELYRQSSIDAVLGDLFRKLKGIPLFLPHLMKPLFVRLCAIRESPQSYFERRLDADLLELRRVLETKADCFVEKHLEVLRNRMERALSRFEAYSEASAFPGELQADYEQELAYFKAILDDKYLELYKKAKTQIDLATWEQLSGQYQRPNEVLSARSQWWTDFSEAHVLDSYQQLEAIYQQQMEAIETLHKNLPKRNDLVIVPLINQLKESKTIKDPLYNKTKKTALLNMMAEDETYFTNYASTILNESDMARLTDNIAYYQLALTDPKTVLGLDLDFLKAEYEATKKDRNWTIYQGIYTEDSIAVAKIKFAKALEKLAVPSDNNLDELYKFYIDFNGKVLLYSRSFLERKVSETYKTSSSSSSTYSGTTSPVKPSSVKPYSDYSDYKDYSDYSDYSDSSFGGGSSGGGGATGGW